MENPQAPKPLYAGRPGLPKCPLTSLLVKAVILDDDQTNVYQARLLELRQEHRDLDDAIHRLSDAPYINTMQLRRMKKRKLQLKDAISKLESLLIPDEPA